MKSIVIFLALLCSLLLVSSHPGTYTTFNDDYSYANLTYIDGTPTSSNDRYVNLAVGSDVLSAVFTITGYLMNYSTSGTITNEPTGITLPSSQSTTDGHGLKIHTGTQTMNLISVVRSSSVTPPTTIRLRATYNGADIATATFSGFTATFGSKPLLSANTDYYLIADSGGGSYTVTYSIIPAPGHYPIERTNFNYVAGVRASTGDDTNLAAVITSININVTPISTSSYPTNVTILLNDNIEVYNFGASNASILNGSRIINITSFFTSPITTYPTKLTFKSNTTGGLYIDNLFFEDTNRNFTFTFYDEQDHNIFDLNSTNTTLTLKCPSSQYEYDITSGTYYVGLECPSFDLIKVNVNQNGQEYWRTLVLSPTAGISPSLDYYLVNLNNKSVVQIILTLDDLTGYKWAGSSVRISRPVNSTSDATIIEQEFDVDNKVYLYLMQDEQYTVTITNVYGEVWSGVFIADAATEKTITLPGTGFGGDTYWEKDLSINYSFELSPLTYFAVRIKDLGNLTDYASVSFYDSTNGTLLYYGEYSESFSDGILFYYPTNNIRGNNTYNSIVRLHHDVLGWVEQKKVWGDYTNSISPEHWTNSWATIIKYFSFLILVIIILGFGAKDSHIGLVICLILMAVFKGMGWLNWINGITLGVLALIIVSNWWRKEEVSAG